MTARKTTKESKAAIIDRFLGEIPPADLLILTAGAIAGSQGYTPLTMLMNIGGGIANWAAQDLPLAVKELDQKVKDDPWKWLTATIIAPIPTLIASWWEEEHRVTYAPPTAPEEAQKHQEAQIAMLAMACIGMIESYAITRPGVVVGLAKIAGDVAVGMAKAASEVIPF